MAVVGGPVLSMNAAADEVAFSITVRRIVWVAGPLSQAGDKLIILDPSNVSRTILEATATGADYTETREMNRLLPFGLRVGTIDRGTVYVEYA